MTDEGHAIHGPAYIDRVGGGGFHGLNPPFGPGNGYGGGIADDLADVVSLGEATDDTRLDRDSRGSGARRT